MPFYKFRLFFFLVPLFSLLLFSCKKDPIDTDGSNTPGTFSVDIGNSTIPYITIDTRGSSIQYEPKIKASMEIFERGLGTKKYNIGIEYRGKTSFRLSDKKPYGIEIWDGSGNDIKESIFGFPEESDWILNNHVVNLRDKYIWDRSLMYNFIGYELARSIGVYASRTKFVEVQINKEYQGLYVFMERLKRDENRINIKSLNQSSTNNTGGYIIKIDKMSAPPDAIGKPLSYFINNWDDDARYTPQNSFRSRYDINGNVLNTTPFGPPYHSNLYKETYFNYDYPKPEDITQAQKTYIQSYVDQFETALATDDVEKGQRTYADFIEINSFVDYFLLNELYRNIDAFRLSTFITKDRDGKLSMGPIWDLNIGFDEGDRIPMNDWIVNYNKHVTQDAWMMPFWWNKLLKDPVFRNAVKARWTTLRNQELSTPVMHELVDKTAKYLKDNGAVSRNYKKWDVGIGVNFDNSVANLKNFLRDRALWMDGMIGSF
jgi:hypothetical protein